MIYTNWQVQVYTQPGGVISHGSPGFGFAANSEGFAAKEVQSCDNLVLAEILRDWPGYFVVPPSLDTIRSADLSVEIELRQQLIVAIIKHLASEKAMSYSRVGQGSFVGSWNSEVTPKASFPPDEALTEDSFSAFGISLVRLKSAPSFEVKLVESQPLASPN